MGHSAEGRDVNDSGQISLAMLEGQNLLRLVEEFIELLVDGRDDPDAGIDRLVPSAYPQDEDAAEEFRASTRGDLLDRRVADALDVRTALEPFDRDDIDPSSAAALAKHEVEIPAADTDAWLRTFSAMRLVVASRLGIDREDAHDPQDSRFYVYDWLGYRLDQIVNLADQRDGL